MNKMNTNGGAIPAPVRLAPIIRAPEREAKDAHRRASQQPDPAPMFTVYVNSLQCRHSASLMKEVRDVHNIPCTVVDIAKGVGVPRWLKGTPSIVVGTDVYCGDTAFAFVESVGANFQQTQEDNCRRPSTFQDMVSGNKAGTKNDGIGCGLSKAFSPPARISEEEAEKKYSGSVDDAVARLMESRG